MCWILGRKVYSNCSKNTGGSEEIEKICEKFKIMIKSIILIHAWNHWYKTFEGKIMDLIEIFGIPNFTDFFFLDNM